MKNSKDQLSAFKICQSLAICWCNFFEGYYDTMDAGYIDDDGYIFVVARDDDVINVAGHR